MVKYIKFFLRFSKIIFLLVVGITVFLAIRASRVKFDFTIEALFQSGSPERRDYDWFREHFGSDDAVLYVAYKAPTTLSADMRRYAGVLSGRLAGIEGIRGVFGVKDAYDFGWSYLEKAPGTRDQREKVLLDEISSNPLFRNNVISRDARTSCLWVLLKNEVTSEEGRARVVADIRKVLKEEEEASGLRFYMAGIPVIENEYVILTKRDILTFLPLAISVFFLLLCFYFRNVMGTFLPLATVGIAMIWTVGLMQIFGIKISILSSITPVMILIIGIADAVHILSRYREDAQLYADKREALARTLLTMVAACFLTTFTTAIGFAALLTTNVYIVQEFGVVTAIGIMITYMVTIQFLPSVLDNLPPFRGRIADDFAERMSDRIMNGIGRINEHRRWLVFAGAAAVVAVSIVGATRIRSEGSWFQDLRKTNPVYQAHEFFTRNLTDVISVDLILKTERPGGINDLGRLRKAEEFQRRIQAWIHPRYPDVRVTKTMSYMDFLKELNRARKIRKAYETNPLLAAAMLKSASLRALPADAKELEECLALYHSIEKQHDLAARMTDVPETAGRVSVRLQNMNSNMMEDFIQFVRREYRGYESAFTLMPTGKSWLAKRAMDSIIENMVSSLGLAAVIIFVSMTLLFRSLKVGLLAIIPNLLPLVVTAGAMGWIGIPLNFSSVTIFSVALGIAVDTTIHYLSRLRLELAVDHDHRESMYRALRGAGRAMIFSTALLVLGFASILTSNFQFTFHFGLLGGIAIITALLGDLFIAPSLFLTFRPKVRRWEMLEQKLKELDKKMGDILEKAGVGKLE